MTVEQLKKNLAAIAEAEERRMTDRELLELAAKAAGLYDEWPAPDYEVQVSGEGAWCSGMGTSKLWNPLTDDGDALRLAVKLKLFIDGEFCCAQEFKGPWFGGGEDEHAGVSHDECDPYAATRRAIVRAAAEVGKAMP